MRLTTPTGVFSALRAHAARLLRHRQISVRVFFFGCRFRPLPVALLILQAFAGFAQEQGKPLSLPRCIELARNAPSSVKRAREQLNAAKDATQAARANFLPQVSISNSFIYNSPLLYDRNSFSFIALNGIREYSSVANSSLELDSSGRLRAIYDRAKANEKMAEVNSAISGRDLERSVAVAYYRVLLARKLAASAEENLQAARDFETKVERLMAGGEASQADLTKASLETALLDRTSNSMNVEVETAEHDLASYWTIDVAAPLVLEDNLDQLPSAPPVQQQSTAYLNRPEFKLFAAQIAGLGADAHQARARMLPQLNLSFQYGIDSNRVTSRDRGYAGFVHLEIPVFEFLRARSEERQFRSEAHAAEFDQSIGKRLFSKEYQDALSELKGAYGQIGITEREVNLAKDNLRLSRLRFESGEGTALDVVTSQSALVQAEIDFYTTRANYLNAISALKVASGQ